MTSDWSYTSPLDDFSGATLYGTGGNDVADLLMGLPLDNYMGSATHESVHAKLGDGLLRAGHV